DRRFSFMRTCPLDMRMEPRGQLTAATIVNEYSDEQLTRLFRELGEEPAARRIASLTQKMRKTVPFRETLPLARAIEKLVGRHGRHHPATQVFQALRMEVNDELGALEEGLRVFAARLERGGRIAVIAFHSLEDRIVKNFFRDRSREWLDKPEWPAPQRNPDYDLKLITPKPVEPTEEERRTNRGFDLAVGIATPFERRLFENGADFGSQHCAAHHACPLSGRRCDPTCSQRLRHKMKSHSRTRCVLVCAAFIGLFSVFSFRLIYLQAIKHDEYAGLAAEKHV